VTAWDAFCRKGPFVGSGGHYSPGPATAPPPFERSDDRWMTFSRHPGPPPITLPLLCSGRERRIDVPLLDALADVSPPTLAPR
jgi:hypothetical protein